jgi:hypothetical protein
LVEAANAVSIKNAVRHADTPNGNPHRLLYERSKHEPRSAIATIECEIAGHGLLRADW